MSKHNKGDKGDHLQVDFGFYKHHGIDLGDGDVIHFGRGLHDLANAKIETVSKVVFSKGRQIKVVESAFDFSADEIVFRAQSRLDETDYDLFDNNCEHFVTWCRTGRSSCRQIEASETVARQTAAIIAKPAVRQFFVNNMTRVAGTRLALKLTTRATGVAIVGDATQAAAELIATSFGKEKTVAKRIGLGTGAATAATLGTVVGGPLGGMTTFGVWVVGQFVADQTVERGKRVFGRIVARNTRLDSQSSGAG